MKTQDSSMLYKLIVLYMLKIADYPLTGSDISDYILLKGYTDYITYQITITNLENDGLVTSETKHNRTFYSLTEDGSVTIESLSDKLSNNLKNDIYSHIITNEKNIKKDHSLQKKIIEVSQDEYIAELTAYDNSKELMNIRLSFPSKALANSACEKFDDASSDIYKEIISRLMS